MDHLDCQLLVRALSSKSSQVELYGIFRDIESLSLSFDFYSVSFIPRSLNSEADLLAKVALCNVSSSAR
ncbi:hypothetical protein BRARA_D01927 [Brassica rapa]|uniref:RNase H type-1 domain-containing protein n=1 Tax=Brassica campestris TaxID=3711 RepID=A0A397ZMG5_BRACM|nr:hypothetical protein BRARA_D01927 [Brassica rapa]